MKQKSLLRQGLDVLVDMSFVGLLTLASCDSSQIRQEYAAPEPKVAIVKPIEQEPTKPKPYVPANPEAMPEPVKGQEYIRLPKAPEEQKQKITSGYKVPEQYPPPFIQNGVPESILVISSRD